MGTQTSGKAVSSISNMRAWHWRPRCAPSLGLLILVMSTTSGQRGPLQTPKVGFRSKGMLQGFPDSINQPDFPSTVVEPGQQYRHEINYVFKVQ